MKFITSTCVLMQRLSRGARGTTVLRGLACVFLAVGVGLSLPGSIAVAAETGLEVDVWPDRQDVLATWDKVEGKFTLRFSKGTVHTRESVEKSNVQVWKDNAQAKPAIRTTEEEMLFILEVDVPVGTTEVRVTVPQRGLHLEAYVVDLQKDVASVATPVRLIGSVTNRTGLPWTESTKVRFHVADGAPPLPLDPWKLKPDERMGDGIPLAKGTVTLQQSFGAANVAKNTPVRWRILTTKMGGVLWPEQFTPDLDVRFARIAKSGRQVEMENAIAAKDLRTKPGPHEIGAVPGANISRKDVDYHVPRRTHDGILFADRFSNRSYSFERQPTSDVEQTITAVEIAPPGSGDGDPVDEHGVVKEKWDLTIDTTGKEPQGWAVMKSRKQANLSLLVSTPTVLTPTTNAADVLDRLKNKWEGRSWSCSQVPQRSEPTAVCGLNNDADQARLQFVKCLVERHARWLALEAALKAIDAAISKLPDAAVNATSPPDTEVVRLRASRDAAFAALQESVSEFNVATRQIAAGRPCP